MIDFVEGKKINLDPLFLSVSTNSGLGYRFLISKYAYDHFKQDEIVKVYAYVQFVNDLFFLYGFFNEEERSFFKTLTLVSGVGPKLAIRVLSQVPYKEFCRALLNEDVKTVTSFPGIGSKTAQKIILETKDRLELLNIQMDDQETATMTAFEEVFQDASLALENFGFDTQKIRNALKDIKKNQQSWVLEDLIKELLSILNKK